MIPPGGAQPVEVLRESSVEGPSTIETAKEEVGVIYTCKFPGCTRQYASTDGVRKHCRKSHSEWLKEVDLEKASLGCRWAAYCTRHVIEEGGEDVEMPVDAPADGTASSNEAPATSMEGTAPSVDVASMGAEELEELLSELLDECVRMELLTEQQVDQLTDMVASGETTDARLYVEWSAKLQAASSRAGPSAAAESASASSAAAAAAKDDAMSVVSSSRSVRLRVRYRPLNRIEAGSLTLPSKGSDALTTSPSREIGHRSLRTYYRQRYRPEGDALGAANPELAALMLQYSKAGVLTNPMPSQGVRGPVIKHERTKQQLHRDKKAFVAQGMTNNTTMNGMKHYKNQSLNF